MALFTPLARVRRFGILWVANFILEVAVKGALVWSVVSLVHLSVWGAILAYGAATAGSMVSSLAQSTGRWGFSARLIAVSVVGVVLVGAAGGAAWRDVGILAAFAAELVNRFIGVRLGSMLPNLYSPPELSTANVSVQVSRRLGILVGPFVGAFVTELPIRVVALGVAGGLATAASMVLGLVITLPPVKLERPTLPSVERRGLSSTPLLLPTIFLALGTGLANVGTAEELLRTLQVSNLTYALTIAIGAATFMVGQRAMRDLRFGNMAIGGLMMGVGLVGIALPAYPLVLIGRSIQGFGQPIYALNKWTKLQRLPPDLRLRAANTLNWIEDLFILVAIGTVAVPLQGSTILLLVGAAGLMAISGAVALLEERRIRGAKVHSQDQRYTLA